MCLNNNGIFIRHYVSIFLIGLFGVQFAQNTFKIRPKYEHLKLIGDWKFDSMETTTFVGNETNTEITSKANDNTEVLSFHRSGSLSYSVLKNREIKKGRGIWLIKDDFLKILVDSDTIYARYEIKNEFLTITTNNEENEEFYGYQTVVKYQK